MTYRVLLDFTATKSIHNGLGQFSLALGNAIIRQKPDWMKIDVLIPKGKEHYFPEADGYRYKNNAFRHLVPGWFKFLFSSQWQYDLWHVTNQNSEFLPLSRKTPLLFTIHDLNFLRERQQKDWSRKIKRIQSKSSRADAINTISYFVKQEVESNLEIQNQDVKVIYNGGVELIKDGTAPVNFSCQPPFLFSIGEFLAKKNFIALVDMMTYLPEMTLVIAGKNTTDYADQFRNKVEDTGLKDRVKLLGFVSDEERQWLYNNMAAFVFPSLTEGFGLPIIEAMSYRKPVFCSNLTSLPEIGGEFPYYWHNFNGTDMASLIKQGLQETKSNGERLIKGQQHALTFNWNRAALEYLNLYTQMLKNPVHSE